MGRSEIRDTFHLWNVDRGLRRVWLSEERFGDLPRSTRAALIRLQARSRRGGVPTVRAWGDVFDPQALRSQADGHRFAWWPSLLEGADAGLMRRIVECEKHQRASRHDAVPVDVWRRCEEILPGARALAGTFAAESGPNCFGTVLAAAGVPDAADAWMLQAPFEAWLATSTRAGGSDGDPGTVLVWKNRDGAPTHAAVTLGGGWALEKPSQCWFTPRAVHPVRDVIRSSRVAGEHLERHTMRQPGSGTSSVSSAACPRRGCA